MYCKITVHRLICFNVDGQRLQKIKTQNVKCLPMVKYVFYILSMPGFTATMKHGMEEIGLISNLKCRIFFHLETLDS